MVSSFTEGDVTVTWNNEIGCINSGGNGQVYEGTLTTKGDTAAFSLSQQQSVAVKIIRQNFKPDSDKLEKMRREFKETKNLDHPNVLKVMHFFEDERVPKYPRYIVVMELSKYRDLACFGYEEKDNKFQSMITENCIDVLLQIAGGLHYIHCQNLVHRDIKPDNILVFSKNPVQVKIGDFGHIKQLEADQRYIPSGPHIGTWAFRSPEIIEIDYELFQPKKKLRKYNGAEEEEKKLMQKKNKLDKTVDIFAAGCTFYYLLTKGCLLPFDGFPFINIVDNIRKNVRPAEVKSEEEDISKTEPNVYDALQIALAMVEHDASKRLPLPDVITRLRLHKIFRKGEIPWSRPDCQGITGSSGVNFVSYENNEKYAFKRLLIEYNDSDQRPVYASLKALRHENLVSVLEIFDRSVFNHIAMEHCEGSLQEYFDKSYKGAMPANHNEALRQLSDGLCFIHKKNYVHGNLHPSNILIGSGKESNGAQLKLSDFGISQFDPSFLPRRLYYAPELLSGYGDEETVKMPDEACDIFAMGCLFLKYLTEGYCHPYLGENGADHEVITNIIKGKRFDMAQTIVQWHRELITDMTHTDPKIRITSVLVTKRISSRNEEHVGRI